MVTVFVGIAGGSASGKTTVVRRLVERLGPDVAGLVEHDRYYRDRRGITIAERGMLNYDHPDALDTELLVAHLASLRAGRGIEAPVYDFSQHTRIGRTDPICPRPVLFVEGVLVLADARLCKAMDLRVFVDTSDATRYMRRLQRDVSERGRTAASVERQYAATVRPMHVEFVEPSRVHADVIVHDGGLDVTGLNRLYDRIAALVPLPR